MKTRRAVLLINLGSPSSTAAGDVAQYLREFLGDRRVLVMPAWRRFLLVNLIIAPLRAKKSAKAYLKIWSEEGSPLLVHTKKLAEKLQQKYDTNSQNVLVDYAMRYSKYSKRAIKKRINFIVEQGISEIEVVPLYPQYSSSTWGSVATEVYRSVQNIWRMPNIRFTGPFYEHSSFIDAQVEIIRKHMETRSKGTHLLFSYHGIPRSYATLGDSTKKFCKLNASCCLSDDARNRLCYRSNCLKHTHKLVQQLGLSADQWSFSFQSRLGKEEWLKPYTAEIFEELPHKGMEHLAVVSPAFVADCLETLEELGMEGRADFIRAGGKSFELVPCLNSHEIWVDALYQILEKNK